MVNAQKAKAKLEQFIMDIDPKLDAYWQTELDINFGFNAKQKELVTKIVDHARDHNLRKAKRLRGAFTYYGYLLGGTTPDDRIWNAAMGVELVQTAILIHDDFMDQDSVRRGKPTTHEYFANGDRHYGDAMAVNVGDAVLCAGFQLILECGFEGENIMRAMSKMLRGVVNTAHGQSYDVTLEKLRNEWTEDDVIILHKAKTAIYTYENPLFIGAKLANLPAEAFTILHDYSMDGGVAFQLQDDILGVYGDPEKTGKSANSDLLQGKCTLLALKTFSDGTPEQIRALEKVWGKRTATSADIDGAKKAIIESGSLAYSNKISREYARKAVQAASLLRKLNLNTESIDFIEGIAEYMVEREL